MGRQALKHAFPMVPLISSLVPIIFQIHPQFICDYEESDNFILTESKERTGQIVDIYLQRRMVLMNNLSESALELHAKCTQKLKSQIVDQCHETMKKIEKMAESFGIKKVGFNFQIPRADVDQECPYSAIGNRFSFMSFPLISCVPPQISIFVDPDCKSAEFIEIPVGQTTSELEFVLAHEMVHIAKAHGLVSSICGLAFSILTSSLWCFMLKDCVLLALQGRVIVGLIIPKILAILGIAFASQLFECTLDRCQEQEADCEAINYLQSNVGAVAFFKKIVKKWTSSIDLSHPSPQERLAYCRALVPV
jgi:hypothetical protein